jgi:hypothetical protein
MARGAAHRRVVAERQHLPEERDRQLAQLLRVADIAIQDAAERLLLARAELLLDVAGADDNLAAHGILRVQHFGVERVCTQLGASVCSICGHPARK